MLMMIYNNISPGINKKTICFHNSWRRQLVMFMPSMNNYKNIVSIMSCLFGFIVLLYWVKRIGPRRIIHGT